MREQGAHGRKLREASMPRTQRTRHGSHEGWRSAWAPYNLRMYGPR